MPQITPPRTWLAAVTGLATRPQSATLTTRGTRIRQVVGLYADLGEARDVAEGNEPGVFRAGDGNQSLAQPVEADLGG